MSRFASSANGATTVYIREEEPDPSAVLVETANRKIRETAQRWQVAFDLSLRRATREGREEEHDELAWDDAAQQRLLIGLEVSPRNPPFTGFDLPLYVYRISSSTDDQGTRLTQLIWGGNFIAYVAPAETLDEARTIAARVHNEEKEKRGFVKAIGTKRDRGIGSCWAARAAQENTNQSGANTEEPSPPESEATGHENEKMHKVSETIPAALLKILRCANMKGLVMVVVRLDDHSVMMRDASVDRAYRVMGSCAAARVLDSAQEQATGAHSEVARSVAKPPRPVGRLQHGAAPIKNYAFLAHDLFVVSHPKCKLAEDAHLHMGRGGWLGEPEEDSHADHGKTTSLACQALRDQLEFRGNSSMSKLTAMLRIVDRDRSGTIDLDEFRRALLQADVNLTKFQIKALFDAFAQKADANVDDMSDYGRVMSAPTAARIMTYERFLRMVRGNMSEYREKMVRGVFGKMDRDHSGMLTQDDIAEAFRTAHHPDVRTGARSEADVLREFTATFEDSAPDGIVTWDEFKEYYANLSASIESDAYFCVMINAAWGLDFAPPHPYHDKVSTFKPIVESEALDMVRGVVRRRGLPGVLELTERFEHVDLQNEAVGTLNFEQFFQLKCGLQQHTARALFNNICNVLPDDGLDEHGRTTHTRTGENAEFGGSLTAWQSSHSRHRISIDELLFAIGGHMMNDRREAVVKRVFDDLDQHGVGYITQKDMVRWYNARMHPSVRAGDMLESEAHQVFISTFTRFKANHNLTSPEISTPDRPDGKNIVTFSEFKDYYCKVNIALSVDTTDEYFEALLLGVWGVGEFADAEEHGAEHLGITLRRATTQDPVSALENEVKALRAKLEGLEAEDAKRREALSGTNTIAAEFEIQKIFNQMGDAKVELRAKEHELIYARERAQKEGGTTFRVTEERPSTLGRRAIDGVHQAHVAVHEHTSQLNPTFTPHAATNTTKVDSFRKPSLGGLCGSHGTPEDAHAVATAAMRKPFDENRDVWNWGSYSTSGGADSSTVVKPAPGPAGHVASHKAIALRHWHGSNLTAQATYADAERRNYNGSNIASGSAGGVAHTWKAAPSRYGHHAR